MYYEKKSVQTNLICGIRAHAHIIKEAIAFGSKDIAFSSKKNSILYLNRIHYYYYIKYEYYLS